MVSFIFNFTHWLERYLQKTRFWGLPKNPFFLSAIGIQSLNVTKQVFNNAQQQQHLRSLFLFLVAFLWAEIFAKIEGPKMTFQTLQKPCFSDNLAAMQSETQSCMYEKCISTGVSTWTCLFLHKCSGCQDISLFIAPNRLKNTMFLTSLASHNSKTPQINKKTPELKTLASWLSWKLKIISKHHQNCGYLTQQTFQIHFHGFQTLSHNSPKSNPSAPITTPKVVFRPLVSI